DERLNALVLAYLEALEAGQTPDRNEWLARDPDLACDLARYFEDQDRLEHLAAPLRGAVQAPPPALVETAAIPVPGIQPFGDYDLLGTLGQGGMGIVYRAFQRRLNRVVALKRIRADMLATPDEVQRFRNEAEAVAQLDHPHIVPLYEVGQHQGQHYFTM